MKILLLGSGAREHALARALASDPATTELVVAPGNPGTAAIATNLLIDPAAPEEVVELATQMGADLVVVGPEAPLVAGVADAVREAGIPCFGPGAEAAEILSVKTSDDLALPKASSVFKVQTSVVIPEHLQALFAMIKEPVDLDFLVFETQLETGVLLGWLLELELLGVIEMVGGRYARV